MSKPGILKVITNELINAIKDPSAQDLKPYIDMIMNGPVEFFEFIASNPNINLTAIRDSGRNNILHHMIMSGKREWMDRLSQLDMKMFRVLCNMWNNDNLRPYYLA